MSLRRGRTSRLALLAVWLTACTYHPSAKRAPFDLEQPPHRGGTLTIAIADDTGALDPQLAEEPSDFAIVHATQRGLMSFPAEGTDPVPDLAAGAPSVSANGLVYTFRLRDGVAFGPPANRPLTSKDVFAGIRRIEAVHPSVARYFGVIGAISTPSPSSIQIGLKAPFNDLLWMLALPQASAVLFGTKLAVAAGRLAPSGPYRVKSIEPGRSITLVRNEAWKQSSDPVRPAWVDEVDVRVGDSAGADVTAEGVAPPDGAEQLSVDGGCFAYLFLNATVLAGPVRRGIALALDRDAIARAVDGKARGSLLGGGFVPRADPAAARRLIGRPYELTMGWEEDDEPIAAAVIPQLGKAGVTIRRYPVRAPAGVYDRYGTPSARVPAGIARWCPDWPGRSGRAVIGSLMDGRGITPSGNPDYAMVNDATLNRLIDAAERAKDPDPAWAKAQARGLSLAAVVPLASLTTGLALSNRVRGFKPGPFWTAGDPASLWLVS